MAINRIVHRILDSRISCMGLCRMNLSSIQYILDVVQDNINEFSPQELILKPKLLEFCAMYGLEKEWK